MSLIGKGIYVCGRKYMLCGRQSCPGITWSLYIYIYTRIDYIVDMD